jgi:hypothetical protein
MLREMDFIATDWGALRWALGGTTAIFRYSILEGVRTWANGHSVRSKEELIRAIGRSAEGLALAVMFCAGVLAACIFALTRVSPLLFPEWHIARLQWAQWVSVLGMPETIFVVAAVALWRKRKTMSAGILLCAITLFAHFLMYVSAHG